MNIEFTIYGEKQLTNKYQRNNMGAVVEWLEQLGYVAKIGARLLARDLPSPCDESKTLSAKPAVKGRLFALKKDKTAKGEGCTSPIICCAQGTVGL